MRYLRKIILLATAALILFFGLASLYIGKQLAQPSRRSLQDYHLSFLETPSLHGVIVRSTVLDELETPVLCLEPSKELSIGKRGEILRKQLREKGVELSEFGEVKGTLVMLHGRTGRKEDLLTAAERFCAIGFRCVIPDMPAHGESMKKSVGFGWGAEEESLASDILSLSAKEFGFEIRNASLWGMSMGGAFAIKGAAKSEIPWEKMILVCTFDSLDSVVEQRARAFGPFGDFLATGGGEATKLFGGVSPKKIRSIDLVPQFKLPVLVVHGTADQLITLEQGEALFSALGSKHKKMIEVPNATHNNILVTDYPLYAAMGEWLLGSFP